MAKQTIGIGSAANDGTGSTLRAAFDICNDNFTELYDGSGGLLHKIEGTNFTGSLLIGHSTTGTLSAAIKNTGVGLLALDALSSGDSNTAIGYNAGSNINSGSYNTMLGSQAGDALTTGGENVAIGFSALSAEDTAHFNIAIGSGALAAQNSDSSSPYNIAIGHAAGAAVSTGVRNLIIGAFAGDALTIGNFNTAIGYSALSTSVDGDSNIAIGYQALTNYEGGDGAGGNVAIGFQAGENVSTGDSNTLIGFEAGDALTTGSNNIIIGNGAAASAVDVSNEVTIGNSSITNVRIPSDSTLKIGASGDLQLEHVSSNSFIKNTAVGDLYIENQVDDKDVIFRSDNGSGGLATYFFLDGSNSHTNFQLNARWVDNSRAEFGNSGDLDIYHDGTDSYIENNTGNLNIVNYIDDGDIIFKSDDGSGGIETYFYLDGNLADGTYNYTRWNDGGVITFGGDQDLRIWHDPSNSSSYMRNYTNDLYIENTANDKDILFRCDDGSGGLDTYFSVVGAGNRVQYNKDLRLIDNVELSLGSSDDLRINHNGTDSFITNYTGDLKIINYADDKDIIFQSDDGSGGVETYFFLDGSSGGTNPITIFPDSSYLKFGSSQDLSIVHSSSGSEISHNGTGDLVIQNTTDDKDIIFKSDDGSGGVTNYLKLWGAIESLAVYKDMLMVNDGNGGKLKFGASQDLEIFHDGSDNFYNGTTGDMYFINKADDKDIIFQSDDGSGGYTTYFFLDGSTATTVASKQFKFEDDVKLFFGTGADSALYASSDDLIIEQTTDDKDIIFKNDNGSGGLMTYLTIDGGAGLVNLPDNIPLSFGTSNDFKISHGSGATNIINETGHITIQQRLDDGDIVFQCDDGSGGLTDYLRIDGSAEQTKFSKNTEHQDNVKALFGNGSDMEIFHDASNSYIENYTGDLNFTQHLNDGDIRFKCDDGSGGTATYFKLDGSATTTVFHKDIRFDDSVLAKFGADNDLRIYHDGSNSYIDDTGTGWIKIRGNGGVLLESYSEGETMLKASRNGAVELYYDNAKKFETTSTGIEVTGTLDATQASTTVPVLRLTDDGVANYDFVFPDDATIKLETSTSSTKTFKLLNAGSGDMNLEVSGSLSKGSGSFKIDHPVKPDTHSLYHSFVESPLTDLIYRGKVKLVEGKASINIDEHFGMTDGTFVALVDNKQVFTTNEDTWDAVKGKVEGNKLNIESQNKTFEGYVSWLVIGDRKDKHIMDADWTDEKGKPILEVEK